MSYCRCSQQSQKMLSYRTLNFKYFCHIVKDIVFVQTTPSPPPPPKKGSSWPKVQHFTNITTAKLIFFRAFEKCMPDHRLEQIHYHLVDKILITKTISIFILFHFSPFIFLFHCVVMLHEG